MSYLERIAKVIPFKDGLHLNNEGGPAGPLNIEKARDWEITWNKGRAVLLKTPRAPTPEGEDMPDKTDFRPELDWDRGGANTGVLPDNPLGPKDRFQYKQKDTKVTEENIPMSYLNRLVATLAKAAPPLVFKDVLRIVKNFYPDLKMQFPKPPTYVWNPKKPEGPAKDEKKEVGKEEEDDTDDTAKLEPQKIKDKLKVKLPQLNWTSRMMDGVEEAELGFDDESTALFEIGAKANHLTLTYYAPPQGTVIKYDDSEPEDSENQIPPKS